MTRGIPFADASDTAINAFRADCMRERGFSGANRGRTGTSGKQERGRRWPNENGAFVLAGRRHLSGASAGDSLVDQLWPTVTESGPSSADPVNSN